MTADSKNNGEVGQGCIFGSSENDVLVRLFNVKVPGGKRENREHKHSRFEIVVFKSGSGVYTTKRRNYSIKAGDVFVFSSNEQHCITQIDGDEMRLMNLHIEPRYFWDSRYDSIMTSNLFFSHSDSFESRLPRNNAASEKIRSLLLEIENEFYDESAEYPLMVRAKITEIIVNLIRNLNYQSKDDTIQPSANLKSVKRSLDYIQKHLTENISLNEIAEYSGMSRSYFSARFCNVMGVKLWDYITEMRIESAMHELEVNKSDKMVDIAMRCGFNNTANFNKAFRKYTGRTPSEYRDSGKAALY